MLEEFPSLYLALVSLVVSAILFTFFNDKFRLEYQLLAFGEIGKNDVVVAVVFFRGDHLGKKDLLAIEEG